MALNTSYNHAMPQGEEGVPKIERATAFKMPVSFVKSASNYILLINLISIIFLQKIGVPVSGGTFLFLSFFILGATCAYGALSGALVVRPVAATLFLLASGFMVLSQLLSVGNFSFTALALMIVMQLPYIFIMPDGKSLPGVELLIFRTCMTILAIFGIIQFFSQYLVGSGIAFFIDYNIPKFMAMPGFHSLNAVEYAGSIFKSNGVFLVEASLFSQFLAIAIIIEIIYFKSLARLALYVLGVAVTFSGTGLIILFTAFPLYLIHKKKILTLILFCAALISSPVWAPLVGLEKTVERASEFTSPKSSAYARFISPTIYINKDLFPSLQGIMFGGGAGALPWSADNSKDFQIFNPTWAKLFYEYGLLGTMFYVLFMGYIFKSSPASFFLKFALFVQFWLLAEYLTPPIAHILILSFIAWPSRDGMQKIKDNNYEICTKSKVLES